MTANIVSVVLLVLAIAVIVFGIMLIKGSLQIPAERERKYAIGAIGAAMVIGLVNLFRAIKPTWPKRLAAKLAK